MVPFTGNLTWQALKRVNTIDDNERELIMSMVGTVIYYPTSQNRDPDVMGPTLTSITQLLYGNADVGSGNVTITLLKCSDFTNCTGVTQNTGDANNDQKVNFSDLLILAQEYGKTSTTARRRAIHRRG